MQEDSNGTACARVDPEYIVNTGGSSKSPIALGWHATNCSGTGDSQICLKDEPCKSGTYGTNPPSARCLKCDAGKFSYDGSLTCEPCGKGKYAPKKVQLNALCPETM